jgi:KUP system potassium uptake protein
MPQPSPGASKQDPGLPGLTLMAIGIVFGDIGTSPLYALRQCFQDAPGLEHEPQAPIAVVSLILWSLILVVCVKYATFVMRADHDGEGGTLALLGLLRAGDRDREPASPTLLTMLVLFGSALLYGDGAVTPAISVLSAVEGLGVATSSLKPAVVPLAVGILVALFVLQPRGTAGIGRLFGPVMVLWFGAIGVLGIVGIVRQPAVLAAFNPLPGLGFLVSHGWTGYLVLGAVVLCFSGAEALFADLGHFGRRPILLGWYGLVLPCLMLSYLGQGGLVAADPQTAGGPFFALVPSWALYPMVALSTAATVIASQALISGVFSLTQQAVSMGLAPRYTVVHTSERQSGQIYVPVVNWFIMAACLALVLGFQSSDRLGAAYGLAVIGTMTVTSVVYYLVLRRVWHWSLLRAAALCGVFLVIDLAFLGANLAKILSGAWVPLVIGGFIFTLLAVWTDGRARYYRALAGWAMPVDEFLGRMRAWKSRGEGTAVFLTPDLDHVPLLRCHSWLRRHVNHEQVVLLRVESERVPHVPDERRVRVEVVGEGLHRVHACFGFMQQVNVGSVLRQAQQEGLAIDCDKLVYYLPDPIDTGGGGLLTRLRRRGFALLRRSGLPAVEYFAITPHQAVLVGLELEI